MKKNLFAAIILCSAMFANAQTQVATLSHKGQTKFFYGESAFIDAMSAAEHGDTINLSAGSFIKTDITKAVTIQGAGIEGNQATIILPDDHAYFSTEPAEDAYSGKIMKIDVRTGSRDTILKIEDVNFANLENFYIRDIPDQSIIQKCVIRSYIGRSGSLHLQFINCIFLSGDPTSDIWDNYNFFNSWREDYGYGLFDNKASGTSFTNCFIHADINASIFWVLSATFRNCVITNMNTGDAAKISSYEMTCENCIIACGNSTTIEGSITNSILVNVSVESENPYGLNNTTMSSISDVFKTYNGTYISGQTYELTDAAKAVLGTDGKEVGLYGGAVPYNVNPSYPRITKLEVGSQSTADGKLSIDIELKTMDEK